MMVSGIGNTYGVQAGGFGRTAQTDAVSKSIQKQIANAQKKLQELSSNETLSAEAKMQRREEIQQEITNLQQQLRQHQMEQRKESQTSAAAQDNLGSSQKTAEKTGTQSVGLSQASMQAIISADSSMKQANVQGKIAAQAEGTANVRESEMKMDGDTGASAQQKEEELTALREKAQTAATAQVSTLAAANQAMEASAQTDGNAESIQAQQDGAEQVQGKADAPAENAKSETGAEIEKREYPSIDVYA